MNNREFSDGFDTMLNSYGENGVSINLDEYEKSYFLTTAQEIIVKTLIAEGPNAGIDGDARRQIDLSNLIVVKEVYPYENPDKIPYNDNGVFFEVPDNILMVLNESVRLMDGRNLVVIPIHYKEYDRQMSKVFSQPLVKQCWRLFQWNNGIDVFSEIIPFEGDVIEKYKLRYVRKPQPIILVDLDFDNQRQLDIDGISVETECELNPSIHRDILTMAVQLAITSRVGGQSKQNSNDTE